jgi:hypothetical protein
MSHKVLLDPVFSLGTGELLSHSGESYVDEFPIRCDRSAQGQAKSNMTTANTTGSTFGGRASDIYNSEIPGLERDANNPQGYTPEQKNNMLVSGGEAVGGANSGIVGQAVLEATRTRNAGGFANSLDEAARIKGRQLSTNALNVNNEDARLAQQKQQEARRQLTGLYSTNTSDQLKAMGLSDEAIQQELEAGKSGWQQNAMNWINTFKPSGSTSGGGGAAAV